MTEREKILAMREGYATALMQRVGEVHRDRAEQRAAKMYPLPKVPRARVVEDVNGTRWKWFDGTLWVHYPAGKCFERHLSSAAIRDVILNPTELVDDDGGEQ